MAVFLLWALVCGLLIPTEIWPALALITALGARFVRFLFVKGMQTDFLAFCFLGLALCVTQGELLRIFVHPSYWYIVYFSTIRCHLRRDFLDFLLVWRWLLFGQKQAIAATFAVLFVQRGHLWGCSNLHRLVARVGVGAEVDLRVVWKRDIFSKDSIRCLLAC